MSVATQWYLDDLRKRAQSSISYNQQRVARADRIALVVQLSQVHIDPLVSMQLRRDLSCLQDCCEKRAGDLLTQQIANIRETEDKSAARVALARYRSQEWVCLRGHFPRLAQKAYAEGEKLLAELSAS